MELIRLAIPYEFIRTRARLDWCDVRFELANELMDPHVAVELASEQMVGITQPSDELIALAGAERGEQTRELVERLSGQELQRSESEIRRKWLYLVLAWLYEHRDRVMDPLQRVEEVYADFGYPEEIESFVRYMPMKESEPDLGSVEANSRRLFERWEQYLEAQAHRYFVE